MGDVTRVYPEARSALINWIEQNFHDIDSFVFTCTLKGEVATKTIYHASSAVEALGIVEVTKGVLCAGYVQGEFKIKP